MKDKPKPPKGPLETTEVTAESCKLKWKPADADEHAPTRGYIVEMQEGPGGPWKKIGDTKGTEFHVNNLKEHEQYKVGALSCSESTDNSISLTITLWLKGTNRC